MNKVRILFVTFLVLGMYILSGSHAQAIGLSSLDLSLTPISGFGGRLIATVPCTCSGTSLVTLADFRTLSTIQLIYIPLLSRLNQSFMLWIPGNFALGTYFGAPEVNGAYNQYLGENNIGPEFDEFGNPSICYEGVFPFCESVGEPVGVITSWPFSGVGTSLTPAI